MIRTLVHSFHYDASCSLLGKQEDSDEILLDLEFAVASHGNRYPIVQVPDVRLACSEIHSIAIFFRLLPGDKAEMISVLLLKAANSLAA